jgi:hypothetical protein
VLLALALMGVAAAPGGLKLHGAKIIGRILPVFSGAITPVTLKVKYNS